MLFCRPRPRVGLPESVSGVDEPAAQTLVL